MAAIDAESFERALADFPRFRRGDMIFPDKPSIRFKPDGLHIEDATFDFPVSLASRRLDFSLHFTRCRFSQPFDARWATVHSLTLRSCRLEMPFVGTALESRGNIEFTGTTSLSQIDLSQARILCDLVLVDVNLSYSEPDGTSTEEPRTGSALFCAGLQVHSVLMDRLHCQGRIFLDASRLTGNLKASDAILERDSTVKSVNFNKWGHIVFSASDTDIHGAVVLGEEVWGRPPKPQSFQAHGQVTLSNSRIGGDLICTNGIFRSAYYNADDEDYAAFVRADAPQDDVLLVSLNVTRTNIDGGVWLNGDFRSYGPVRFDSSNVKGTFCCSGGTIIGALPLCEVGPEDRRKRYKVNFAFDLYRVEIGGTLLLDNGFIAFGRVSLRNAVVRGDLVCQGGTFHACWREGRETRLDEEEERQPEALALSGTEIGGSVFLTRASRYRPSEDIVDNPLASDDRRLKRQTFRSYGQVRLRGAQIARDLHLGGGCFDVMPAPDDWEKKPAPKDTPKPLVGWFQSAKVEGTIFFVEVDRFPVCFCGSVSFADVRTGGWQDSVECWPHCSGDANTQGATLELNGLTYDSLRGPTSGEERLIWLLHQPKKDLSRQGDRTWLERLMRRERKDADDSVGFKAQPWEQCIAALRKHGYHGDAGFLRRIEQRLMRYMVPMSLANRLSNFVVSTFVEDGSRAIFFALLWAVWLVGLGTIVADSGYRDGYVVPTAALTNSSRESSDGNKIPVDYPYFHPSLFSLDMALPPNLRQANDWRILDQLRGYPAASNDSGNSPIAFFNRGAQHALFDAKLKLQSSWPLWSLEIIASFALAAVVTAYLRTPLLTLAPTPRFRRNPILSRGRARALYLKTLNRGSNRFTRILLPLLIGALVYFYFVAWSSYIINDQIVFQLIDVLNAFTEKMSRMSFVHVWFEYESFVSWILETAIVIPIGTRFFQYGAEGI